MAIDIVVVEWHDAHLNGFDEADAADTVHRPWRYTSAGLLVKSDEAGVTIAMDQGEDGRYRTRSFIPRAMVAAEWIAGTTAKRRRRAPRKEQPDANA